MQHTAIGLGRRELFRTLIALLVLCVPGSGPALGEQPPKVAVFDFELMDTSLQGEKEGPRADEHERLSAIGRQIRDGLAASGQFMVLDIGPVRAKAAAANLQSCGGCDADFASTLGADLSITGVVQKVSNLILGLHVFVRDVRTGQLVTVMNADFRGNTDESWSRAADYLLRNRLLAPQWGAPR